MTKVLYMDATIQMLGKKDKKATQKLIDENEVVHTDSVSYLSVDNQPIEIRKTLDGRPLVELDEPMALIVNTKVPHKWILQDTETGEIYRGTTETQIGKQWEKIIEINE
jgi:hypothetical protein